MNTKKTHYRNVFKSDHLGSADLEDLTEQGTKLIFTIREVKQEFGAKVAGKKGDFNIAYFKENIKPLVLNATNSKQIKLFTGTPFVENWKDVLVELYVEENVRAVTGGVTQGVRIRQIQPKIQEKVKPYFLEVNFENAKKAGATLEQIKSKYLITEEMEQDYLIYATTE